MRSDGTNTSGGVVSLTVIENDFVCIGSLLLPLALHITLVVPIGNADFDGGSQFTATLLPDASVADTE